MHSSKNVYVAKHVFKKKEFSPIIDNKFCSNLISIHSDNPYSNLINISHHVVSNSCDKFVIDLNSYVATHNDNNILHLEHNNYYCSSFTSSTKSPYTNNLDVQNIVNQNSLFFKKLGCSN